MKLKKLAKVLLVSTLAVGLLTGCSSGSKDDKTIKVGASPTPHAEILEAAKSFGATKTQIIFKVMIKEAMPSIISGITLSVISILGYTAMAGTVGAGGLGKVALVYGHQRFDTAVMVYVVITLIIIVQAIQMLGDYVYKKLK